MRERIERRGERGRERRMRSEGTYEVEIRVVLFRDTVQDGSVRENNVVAVPRSLS